MFSFFTFYFKLLDTQTSLDSFGELLYASENLFIFFIPFKCLGCRHLNMLGNFGILNCHLLLCIGCVSSDCCYNVSA